mmetsp:Transcript_2670/g.8370  ORF Transcript_2670/g.8370 Transcript_2670/m.8370 type:complete len:240 (+) Transcript_2670:78-797(+)
MACLARDKRYGRVLPTRWQKRCDAKSTDETSGCSPPRRRRPCCPRTRSSTRSSRRCGDRTSPIPAPGCASRGSSPNPTRRTRPGARRGHSGSCEAAATGRRAASPFSTGRKSARRPTTTPTSAPRSARPSARTSSSSTRSPTPSNFALSSPRSSTTTPSPSPGRLDGAPTISSSSISSSRPTPRASAAPSRSAVASFSAEGGRSPTSGSFAAAPCLVKLAPAELPRTTPSRPTDLRASE